MSDDKPTSSQVNEKPKLPSYRDPAVRRTYIGGSDATAVLGKDRWKSRVAVWMEKTSDYVPEVDSAVTRLGVIFEAAIAAEWSVTTGMKIRRSNKLLRHPGFDWIGCHLDREVVGTGRKALLEVKTHGLLNPWNIDEEWGEENTDQVPRRVFYQCMHQIMVAGAEVCYVVALIPGKGIVQYIIERNEEIIGAMMRHYIAFKEEYWDTEMPPPTETYEDAALLFPEGKEEERVEADKDTLRLHRGILTTTAKRKELEKTEKAIKGQIGEFMKKATLLVDGDGNVLVTWNNITSERIDPKRLRLEAPNVAKKFSYTTTGRKMLPKKIKEKKA